MAAGGAGRGKEAGRVTDLAAVRRASAVCPNCGRRAGWLSRRSKRVEFETRGTQILVNCVACGFEWLASVEDADRLRDVFTPILESTTPLMLWRRVLGWRLLRVLRRLLRLLST